MFKTVYISWRGTKSRSSQMASSTILRRRLRAIGLGVGVRIRGITLGVAVRLEQKFSLFSIPYSAMSYVGSNASTTWEGQPGNSGWSYLSIGINCRRRTNSRKSGTSCLKRLILHCLSHTPSIYFLFPSMMPNRWCGWMISTIPSCCAQ